MHGWSDSFIAAVRVCGPGPSAAKLMLMVAYNFSQPTRRVRLWVADVVLRLFGAPRAISVSVRDPRCKIWLRPYDSGDVQSFIEVFVSRCYPPPTKGVVLDAGANIGLFSVFAAAAGSPERIVSVEPDPANARLARRNLAAASVRAEVVEAALWSADGVAYFIPSGQSNTGRVVSVKEVESYEVPTVSPDNPLLPPPEQIDYLKIDIEGAESEVLADYVDRLRPGSRMLGELHGSDLIESLSPLLESRWSVLEFATDWLVFEWVAT